jgi:hypothetical protein
VTFEQKLELSLKAIGGFVALSGALLAVWKYLDEKRKANETAASEARKPFSAKQLEIYLDLVNTTAFISNRMDEAEWEPTVKHFWVLFWGGIPMVADEGVAKAVDDFADTITDPPDGIAMRNASMNLARACRFSLGESWDVSLDHYAKSDRAGTR